MDLDFERCDLWYAEKILKNGNMACSGMVFTCLKKCEVGFTAAPNSQGSYVRAHLLGMHLLCRQQRPGRINWWKHQREETNLGGLRQRHTSPRELLFLKLQGPSVATTYAWNIWSWTIDFIDFKKQKSVTFFPPCFNRGVGQTGPWSQTCYRQQCHAVILWLFRHMSLWSLRWR